MKLVKKYSKGIIALVLCMLLATTALATEVIVSYSATLDDDVLCVNELAKTVTLTAKVDKLVDMDAFTAQVKVPNGWTIKGIANNNLNSAEFNFNLENGMILWYASNAENVSNDLLATVSIEVPADTPAGEYTIEFELIDISRDWGMPWEDGEILTATLTIGNHADGNDADHLCDYGCGEQADDGCHGGTATCQTPATCVECGQTYGDVDKNNHTGEVAYTNNGDTHSATYDCCGAAYVTDEAHDFTNGDCVCGEKKPEEPSEPTDPTDPTDPDPSEPTDPTPGTGLKGDLDLDGDVDAFDLTLLARHVGGIEMLTDAEALKNADVNGDDTIDANDLTKHARFIGGIITDWNED